jgi:hypothetical protein
VPLPELVASGQDCAVTRADRAGNKVWARVICTGTAAGSASAAAASASTPAASASAGAPTGSAGRTLEIRSGAKVIASTPLGPAVRADEVAVDLPAGAPEILLAALTGEDAIAEDDQAPVVASGGALPTAVVVDAALTHVATGGPPPIEQAFAALQLDAQIHPLPAVPEHDAELNAYAALIVDDAPGFTPEVRRSIAAWIERGAWRCSPSGRAQRGPRPPRASIRRARPPSAPRPMGSPPSIHGAAPSSTPRPRRARRSSPGGRTGRPSSCAAPSGGARC